MVKTVVRPLFERNPGGALSAEKRTEFFLPHSKICKWSDLWSPVLHCICRQPVSILSVTQTVVKSIALRISFCDAVDKEKGFENSIIFATIAAGLYNRQFLKVIRRGETPPEIIMSSVNRASSASAGDKLMAVGRLNDVSAQFATTAVMYDFGLCGIALISVVVAHD